MRYRLWWFSLIALAVSLLAGCGTSSRVDEFVQGYETDKQITVADTQTGDVDTITASDDEFLSILQTAPEDVSTVRWSYRDYTGVFVTQAKESGQRIVIVVIDPSCDNCIRLDRAINTSLSLIPSDVMILKLDYAQARELYQVKEMNTVIIIDEQGNPEIVSDGWVYTMENLLYYL